MKEVTMTMNIEVTMIFNMADEALGDLEENKQYTAKAIANMLKEFPSIHDAKPYDVKVFINDRKNR